MEKKELYTVKDKLQINSYIKLYFRESDNKNENSVIINNKYFCFGSDITLKSSIKKDDIEDLIPILNDVFKLYLEKEPISVIPVDKERYIIRIENENKSEIMSITIENCNCIFNVGESIDQYLFKVKNIYKGQRNIYFRGQSFSHLWLPSLYRNREWIENEKNLNLRVMSRHVSEFFDCNTTIEKLIKLKHYNMPSRLLDIVASPLMALYFACVSAKQNNEDAMVAVIFSDPKKEKFSLNSDTVTMLSNLSNIDLSSVLKSNIAHREKNLTSQLGYACQKEQKTDMYWSNIKIEDLDNCIVVNPEMNNPRIIQQQGLFVLCGFSFDNENSLPTSYFDLFRNIEQKRIYFRFSKDKIDELLIDLDSFGINDSSVYFDLEKTINYEKNRILENS